MQWLKLLSFGPSMSSRSFLHELDPRSKLMFVVTYVSLVTHSNELVSMVLYTSIGLLFVYAARLPLRYVWHGLKGLFPIMLLFICYQLLFGDVKHAFILPWKLMLFMITLIVFSATTTPTKLADGLESILKPLTFVRFPVQNFVMMISVAFRFIPILIGEAHAMLMAQIILNARYELGHFRLKVQSYVQFLVALFIAVLRRAYQLAFAMEARCYFPGNTTRSSHLSFRWHDWGVMIYALILIVIHIILRGAASL